MRLDGQLCVKFEAARLSRRSPRSTVTPRAVLIEALHVIRDLLVVDLGGQTLDLDSQGRERCSRLDHRAVGVRTATFTQLPVLHAIIAKLFVA